MPLEKKYMPFSGPSAIFGKIHSSGTYTNDAMLRFEFWKTRLVTVPRFGFFVQDSRLRVKDESRNIF